MAEIKGTETITQILNKYFAEEFEVSFNFDIDFSYMVDKEQINYTLLVDDEYSKWFLEYISHLAPKGFDCFDIFVMSCLHELGHHMTIWDISDKLYDSCLNAKIDIENQLKKDQSQENKREMFEQYVRLPDETNATLWAINYAMEHSDMIAALQEELNQAFKNFYELNGVDE